MQILQKNGYKTKINILACSMEGNKDTAESFGYAHPEQQTDG